MAFSEIFRTDFGDNEGGEEWMSVPGAGRDPKGDDDVTITIQADGKLTMNYLVDKSTAADAGRPTIQPTDNRYRPERWRPFRRYRGR